MSGYASAIVTIRDPHGLHLRQGKDVVTVASRFVAAITALNVSRPSMEVDVKSILQLMQLQARQGHQIRLRATGPDADEAIVSLTSLFQGSGT